MKIDTPMGELREVKVLDHGFVRLCDHMGDDLSIVRAARVSYDAAWRAGEDEGSDKKLIGYLMRNRHSTPFEAVQFQFEMKAPIFVFRQLHRHRTQSINELSARYRELPEEFYVPSAEIVGQQATNNKQARDIDGEPDPFRVEQVALVREACLAAFKTYKHLLACGWPRELARVVLPLNTYSHMFTSMNLHNLFHLLELRMHQHAQWETQQFAKAMLMLIEPIVPAAVAAWKGHLGINATP